MPDREKAIKGLELCSNILGCIGNIDPECPYALRDGGCRHNDLLSDALDLLKEREPVEQKASEWLEDSDPGQEYGTTWACRECMHSIHKAYIWNPYDSGYKYCPHCGAMMEVRLNA